MNTAMLDLSGRELSFEEFEQLAANIPKLPLDTLCDLWSLDYPSSIREYLYGPKGELLEHTVCSSLDEDLGT